MGITTTVRTLVLVEGDSDAGAVRALADLLGCDLDLHHIQIWSADGVTNFPRLLTEFVRTHQGATFCGMQKARVSIYPGLSKLCAED